MHCQIQTGSDRLPAIRGILDISIAGIGEHVDQKMHNFAVMELTFYKYQGAGNDFVLIDNREGTINLTNRQIAHLCDRHFGIGADGLMYLQLCNDADFQMVYFNSDGNESTMCGNGGRCIAAFAHYLGVVGERMRFKAIDGMHEAVINKDNTVALHMQDVTEIEFSETFQVLNTGSPHYVVWVEATAEVDVFEEGRNIRNQDRFQPKGINVNFVSRINGDGIAIRTYERGVEDETLACGTGVTAAAIVSAGQDTGKFDIPVKAVGGDLSVAFEKKDAGTAQDIVLTGGAQFVFKGSMNI